MKSFKINSFIIGLFALGLIFSTKAFAQEKKLEFTGGVGLGSSSFINYSSVSTFGDINETSSSYLFYINFGLNFNQLAGFDIKLRLNQSSFIQNDGMWNVLEERSSLAYFGINRKLIFPITERMDIVPFIGIGGLFQGSNIDFNTQSYTPTRFGLASNIGLSLSYELSERLFISATAETLIGGLKEADLPTELTWFRNNSLSQINSFDFSFSFHIKL